MCVCIIYRVIRLIFLSNISFSPLFGKCGTKISKKMSGCSPLLFYLGFYNFFFQKRLVLSVGERRKSHVPLIIIVTLFCISLVVVSSLSSNTRSWEDKGNQSEMILTRAQKRRMGERDVWDLIVNNDDICFKHILPRLDLNDVKFL